MTEDSAIVRDYLALHGDKLIEKGYSIIPIQQGKKSPGFDGWQKSRATRGQLKDWLDGGFRNAGVGILTKFTCAIDIDCLEEATALKFEEWCKAWIGYAPVRVGKAPKRLLLYRTVEPFRKRRSAVWLDEWKDKQMIEVLGDGQQFVAFHVHPETGKAYEWIGGESPLTMAATELTELKSEQVDQLLAEFEKHAVREGWTLYKNGLNTGHDHGGAGGGDADNPWVEDTAPITISDDELRSRLLLIGGADDYETWFRVGMALFHQYDGEQMGFDLWNEWSETADNYDPDSLDRHWKSFGIEGKKRAPLTARFLLRLSKEAVEKTALELGVRLRDAFTKAADLAEWEKARAMAREAEIDGLARSALAQVAKDRHDAITGMKTSLTEIRKAIAYLPRRAENMPSWCEDWVYDTGEDKFFHLERKIACTKQGFDAMYDRQALTKADILNGKSTPSMGASELALNAHRIPVVDGRRYMPGRDAVFHEPDGVFANSYPEHEIPARPDKVTPMDKRNIERVRAHIGHLLRDEEEQRMLLDWLAWVVQHPGRHVNYAVLLQGVEGDGKSFFAEFLRAVMGVSNVRMSNADTIITSPFTDWVYGHCVCCVEEVRFASNRGVDKWQAINKIKPFITNNVIEVHPKGKPTFDAINTVSYLLFSNFKDALPIDENSRRFLVLFSQWQRKDDIRAFKEANPKYYVRLYRALVESAGALRQWMLDHECSHDFDPLGDAPDTKARTTMIRKSKPEFTQVLDDIIAEDREVCASRDLLDLSELSDVMMATGVEWPGPKALGSMLERDGYENLGKVRLSPDAVHRFYSKNPSKFTSWGDAGGEMVDPTKVRAYLKARQAALDDDAL
jgi:hypothetical protein